ncbi:BREX-1 system adenine-specific DNA-methyltransferase PglX [Kosakonia sp. ML.JS2a]|uniref:BREX-1 system adenine-specific DNA-methyltransferase PglX n=1 Tax=Kosakonia sp. ML.JS2a TaxID=2980557 RepID=UPI0021D81B7D|nr:BREX-1 system adenine-specific DNA-methyltransferase PglX [Kosakonia sp. ML.JS2a]UXY09028.1 BREX-1 system adenine-specific DNA-methyltransferase PglX [Kosakonia sp. ML.JS2a]
MNTEKIVMMDSDEAASIQTVTGWVDRYGRFWGKDEVAARWSGATHRKCKNKPDQHPIHAKNFWCEICHQEARQKTFDEMEKQVWKGEPLVIFDDDMYFFDISDLVDYCEEHNLLPSEIRLVICKPNMPPEIDMNDHLQEIIPDGGDHNDIPEEIWQAAEALNKALRESPAISWSAGNAAAIVSDDILTDERKAEIMAERA